MHINHLLLLKADTEELAVKAANEYASTKCPWSDHSGLAQINLPESGLACNRSDHEGIRLLISEYLCFRENALADQLDHLRGRTIDSIYNSLSRISTHDNKQDFTGVYLRRIMEFADHYKTHPLTYVHDLTDPSKLSTATGHAFWHQSRSNPEAHWALIWDFHF